jgi:hypothetical protein
LFLFIVPIILFILHFTFTTMVFFLFLVFFFFSFPHNQHMCFRSRSGNHCTLCEEAVTCQVQIYYEIYFSDIYIVWWKYIDSLNLHLTYTYCARLGAVNLHLIWLFLNFIFFSVSYIAIFSMIFLSFLCLAYIVLRSHQSLKYHHIFRREN